MFELKITSLQEFKMFIELIRNEPINEEDVKALSNELAEATQKLTDAEKGA